MLRIFKSIKIKTFIDLDLKKKSSCIDSLRVFCEFILKKTKNIPG